MNILFKLMIITVPCLFLSCAQAEEKIYKIGTFSIPLMEENEESGVFIELAQELAKRADINIEITLKPTKRTIADFEASRIAGFFPALDVSLPKKAELSSAVYVKKDFAFVLKQNRAPRSIFDLKGKTIGLTAGFPYVSQIASNPSIKIDYANTDELNVKKLMRGRFDVFVVEEKSGIRAFEKESVLDQVTYEPSYPLAEQKVFFAFQPSAEGKMLVKKFSEALDSAKRDGTFQRIMKRAE